MRNDIHIRSHPFIHDNPAKKKFQSFACGGVVTLKYLECSKLEDEVVLRKG